MLRQQKLDNEERQRKIQAQYISRDNDSDDENFDVSSKAAATPVYQAVDSTSTSSALHMTTCNDCGESMRASQLLMHLKEKCFRRKILCPNRQFGCTG